jgi:endonuclease/exonuclease/phosphatase family metal-dependent hydrolase
MRVLTWNLYHGRSDPPAGRSLLNEFARALDGWEWDVALLQEVPPWWVPLLARGCGASQRHVLTSRNAGLALRRAVSARKPDLLKSNGGGANAILVRGQRIVDAWALRLCLLPERRWAHGVLLANGVWVVNLHASTEPKDQTRRDIGRALAAADRGPRVVFGGDLNLSRPVVPGYVHAGGHWVDHLHVRGLEVVAPGVVLDAGELSDHRPLACTVG